MNKNEAVEALLKKLPEGTSKVAAGKALDAVLEVIREGAKTDGTVQFLDLGTFSVVDRAARTGVNPATGEKIKIAAKKALKFKPSKAFKDAALGKPVKKAPAKRK